MAKDMKRALSKLESVRVAEVREALEGEDLPGIRFVAVATITGPFAVVGLVVGTTIIIKKAVPGSRVIEIPLESLPPRPFDISWTVFAGHNIPFVGAFLNIENTTIIKLGEKKKLDKGKLWSSSRTIV